MLKAKFLSFDSLLNGDSKHTIIYTLSSKINKISKYLKKNKSDYIFISAPENVAWILNIRGGDGPNSPVPNCKSA